MNLIPTTPGDARQANDRDGTRFGVRIGSANADIASARQLRARVFRGGGAGSMNGETDPFDQKSSHVLVEDRQTGELCGCCRIFPVSSAENLAECYSARFYDLSALSAGQCPMLEIGRFCVHPSAGTPDVARLIWAAIAAIVDHRGVEMIFGATSFRGTSAHRYRDTFAYLARHHQPPEPWRVAANAPEVVSFPRERHPDWRRALKTMPPPLRSYLALGAWVSDHAVVDRDLNTLHVFTGLEVARVPKNRKAFFRKACPNDIDLGQGQG